jgi:xanthine/uracil/vitamin C permease (AzgA family)
VPGDEDDVTAAGAANRSDIRRIIGALFRVDRIVLVVGGVVGAHHVKVKTPGISVNLWTGLALLVVAGLMIASALLRPVLPESPQMRAGGSGRMRRAPAT